MWVKPRIAALFFVLVVPAEGLLSYTHLSGMTKNYQACAERHRVNKLNGKKGVNMTRNDIKALFPEADKAQIDALLDINSQDIGKAVSKGQTAQEQLEGQVASLNEQVKNLTGQAKSLSDQITSLTGEIAQRDSTIKTLTDEKDTALKDLKAQHEVDVKTLTDKQAQELKTLQDALKAAQDKSSVVETLTDRVAKLTQDIADRDATIRNTTKQYRIKDEVRGRRAKNVDVVMKMLDIDKITEDEEGNMTGLGEQLDALVKSDAYLFDDSPSGQRGGFSGNPDIGGDSKSANDAVNKAIRALSGHN